MKDTMRIDLPPRFGRAGAKRILAVESRNPQIACMSAWNRLWSFVIRLLWPGSRKEHLRSAGRWKGSDENSTGRAVECGDVAHVDQNCPAPARKFVAGRMHSLIDIYAHAGVFDPEQVRIITGAFEQTWQAVQDTEMPFASNGVAEAIGDVVALRIIAMARLGELDCDRLREGALRYLAEMKETATQARGD